MSEPLLQVTNLTKRFEGIVATDNLTFNVIAGELHAIIGPNGAGKTTLIAQVGGQVIPIPVVFALQEMISPLYQFIGAITSARHARFRLRLSFLDFSVLDNVALAVQAHVGHSFRFWRDARKDPKLRQPAQLALARVGLAQRADLPASALSHGEHRLLELAIALASEPRMLLLDEPMAGLGPENLPQWSRFLRALKRELTILLVEHDMEAVFALANRITVLVYGRAIAVGPPEVIRANEEVRQAYLGEADEG